MLRTDLAALDVECAEELRKSVHANYIPFITASQVHMPVCHCIVQNIADLHLQAAALEAHWRPSAPPEQRNRTGWVAQPDAMCYKAAALPEALL